MIIEGDRAGQKSIRPSKIEIKIDESAKKYSLSNILGIVNIRIENYKYIMKLLLMRSTNKISKYLNVNQQNMLFSHFFALAKFGISYKDIEYIYGYQINEKTIRTKVKEIRDELHQYPIKVVFQKYEFTKMKGKKYSHIVAIEDNSDESKNIIFSHENRINIFLSRMLEQVIYLYHRKTKKSLNKSGDIVRLKEYNYKK